MHDRLALHRALLPLVLYMLQSTADALRSFLSAESERRSCTRQKMNARHKGHELSMQYLHNAASPMTCGQPSTLPCRCGPSCFTASRFLASCRISLNVNGDPNSLYGIRQWIQDIQSIPRSAQGLPRQSINNNSKKHFGWVFPGSNMQRGMVIARKKATVQQNQV